MTDLAPSEVAGQATFSGCLAELTISRDAVRRLVPSSLSPLDDDRPGHPCLFAFGEQRNGTTFFGGLPVPWGISYHELMIAVPFVRCEDLSGDQIFVAGMTCDFWPPVWNGNVYYGFSKRLTRMTWDGERFAVIDADDGGRLDATLEPRAGETSGQLSWIQAAAALPVLGRRADGSFVQSRFDWSFHDATIEPAALRIAATPAFRELPLDATHAIHADALRVRGMRWRLSWPMPVPSARA